MRPDVNFHGTERIWDGPPNDGQHGGVRRHDDQPAGVNDVEQHLPGAGHGAAGRHDQSGMALVATVNTFLPSQRTYWVDWPADTLRLGAVGAADLDPRPGADGNAKQFTSTGWANLIDTGSGTVQGLPFIVEGATDCAALSDVPWLSVRQRRQCGSVGARAGDGELQLDRPGQRDLHRQPVHHQQRS